MTPRGYTEDQLVEQPAIALLQELGWEFVNAYAEWESGTSSLGRETSSDAILPGYLESSLRRLNPEAAPQAIRLAMDELARGRSKMSLVKANQEVYSLLKNGVKVRIPDEETGGDLIQVVRIIDWENPGNNHFLLCSQLWISGDMYKRRADLVGFVNGIPLLLVELKAAHRRLETAFNGNIQDYKDTVPQLFWLNAFIILSNGSQSRMGSVSAGWEHYNEWKKIEDESESGKVSLETMLRGICQPERFLDIVESFTIFQDSKHGPIKMVTKNHQYLGVNNAITALGNIRQLGGKLGVFWHTQGSGKSVSMIFFAQKVLRKVPGNWTFVLVTDRQELDGQIYKHFQSAGIISESRAQAESSMHLRQLLSEDHRYVFTLIHKFRTERGQEHPVLSTRDDIIVITDEAHRSQYDTLALNMRTALPNAAFLAFTGTPLIAGEEKTREVFGDYVSIYDFQQSVIDKATVPLYYENRIPELQLVNDQLNEDLEALLAEEELNPEQESKLERVFKKEYHLITREDRLEAIAHDLVEHFTGRGFQGKAMMICIDKVTALRMHDKVRAHWDRKIKALISEAPLVSKPEADAILENVRFMQETDMAVVVSQGQNEISEMRGKGLDIRPHRKRMVEEELEVKFKDPNDPLRLVFVCAMWMTGFDVPSCSTLYLDKPMRNHTLMQTIARANRVFPGKISGLIVDYAGVFRNLEKALAIYGVGDGSDQKPVEDKLQLINSLHNAIDETLAFATKHGVDIKAIQKATGFTKVGLLEDAVAAFVGNDEVKRQYMSRVNLLHNLFKAILPDTRAREYAGIVTPVEVIAEMIRSLNPYVDISKVMQRVEYLLDRSIAAEGYVIEHSKDAYGLGHIFDLSNIDFEKLAEQFKGPRKKIINERLKNELAMRLDKMMLVNRTRIDFLESFQLMIEEYNAGSLNAEEFFRRLQEFTKSLDKEEQRAVREQLSEEELAVFDILTKPELTMSAKDREKVKATAKELLATLKKEKLVLDWRKRQQTRAAVQVSIEQTLDIGLPELYTPQLFEQKSALVFQYVYEVYS